MKPAQIFNKNLVEYLSCEKCGFSSRCETLWVMRIKINPWEKRLL
jgi:hypothetical protein